MSGQIPSRYFWVLSVAAVPYIAYVYSSSLSDSSSCTPLFVFGASMVDVGENAQAMPKRSAPEFPPYGMDYFPRPASRYSNGRLFLDFISEGLGDGLIEPFLKSVGADFSCGVDFASSGSTARNTTISGDGSDSSGLFSMSIQVDQFQEFKLEVLAATNQSTLQGVRLPSAQDFLDGIYFVETGHNDYGDFTSSYPDYDGIGNVTLTISAMEKELKRLYNEGARNIVVMNLIPLGCAPSKLAALNPTPEEQDEYGCSAAFNGLVNLHNTRLEELLRNLTDVFPSAKWALFDANSIFWDAIRNPSRYGIKYTTKSCCGAGGGKYNYNENVTCGTSGYIDGVLTKAWRCHDPSLYIFWDSLHPVESFAKFVASGFLTREYIIFFTNATMSFSGGSFI